MPEVAMTILGRDLVMRSAILPISLSTKPRRRRNSALRGRIVLQEFAGKTDRPQGQADGLANMTIAGNCELATSTTEINHQNRSSSDSLS